VDRHCPHAMGVESTSPSEVGSDVTTNVNPQFWHRKVMVTVLSECRVANEGSVWRQYGAVLSGTRAKTFLSHVVAVADVRTVGGTGVAEERLSGLLWSDPSEEGDYGRSAEARGSGPSSVSLVRAARNDPGASKRSQGADFLEQSSAGSRQQTRWPPPDARTGPRSRTDAGRGSMQPHARARPADPEPALASGVPARAPACDEAVPHC
jgi:hypothetical protein